MFTISNNLSMHDMLTNHNLLPFIIDYDYFKHKLKENIEEPLPKHHPTKHLLASQRCKTNDKK